MTLPPGPSLHYRARKWSGFVAQNQDIKEEWALLEACEARAKVAEATEGPEQEHEQDDRLKQHRGCTTERVTKSK